jgi:hypothetical protein
MAESGYDKPMPTPPVTTSPADNTRPEEKAMALKLMQELKASGVTVPTATPTAAPVPVGTPVEAKTVAPPPPPAIVTPEVKKSKKFGLPSLKMPFRKKTTPAIETPPVSEVAHKVTSETLIKMIDDTVTKVNEDEYIVIKISKPGMLLLSGLLLALVWLYPLIKIAVAEISKNGVSFSVPSINFAKKTTDIAVVTALPSPTPAPITDSRIRVRIGNDSIGFSSQIKGVLNKAGFQTIDIVYDDKVNAKTVLVVTKAENAELQKTLTEALVNDYNVSSESASLTEDSDFAATILVGAKAGLGK